jgi:hypothetical protein
MIIPSVIILATNFLDLIRRLESIIPASIYQPENFDDPIIHEVMKLNPHKPVIVTDGHNSSELDSINNYSSKLQELLYLLNEEKDMDDNSRIAIESSLFELTSYVPKPIDAEKMPTPPVYPNESLSKIVIENYTNLVKFSSTYFNLSLSSHVTKYIVELIHKLQYWEIYHLIYLVPNLEYFLKLTGFEVNHSSFGVMIKPHENYLNDSMLSGLQYPFPYPFYNFSYHSFDSKAEHKKFNRVSINAYAGIRVMEEAKKPKPVRLGKPAKTMAQLRQASAAMATASTTAKKPRHSEAGSSLANRDYSDNSMSDFEGSDEDDFKNMAPEVAAEIIRQATKLKKEKQAKKEAREKEKMAKLERVEKERNTQSFESFQNLQNPTRDQEEKEEDEHLQYLLRQRQIEKELEVQKVEQTKFDLQQIEKMNREQDQRQQQFQQQAQQVQQSQQHHLQQLQPVQQNFQQQGIQAVPPHFQQHYHQDPQNRQIQAQQEAQQVAQHVARQAAHQAAHHHLQQQAQQAELQQIQQQTQLKQQLHQQSQHPAFDRPFVPSQDELKQGQLQHQQILQQIQLPQRDQQLPSQPHVQGFQEQQQPYQIKVLANEGSPSRDENMKPFTPPLHESGSMKSTYDSSPISSTSPRRPEDFIGKVEHSVKNDKPSDVSSSDEDEEVKNVNNDDEEDDDDDYSINGLQSLSNMDSMMFGDEDEDPFSFKSNNPILQFQNQIKFVPQSPRKQNELSETIEGLIDDPSRKNKSSVIHQCHLTDPTTLRRCLKIFYGKNELLRHQEFVHATKKKIYKCVYCAKSGSKVQSYPRHDSLARHIRRKHGVTGKENKMAVNYAKENVEVIDDPMELVTKMRSFNKPLPHPQFLNSDFTIKTGYAEFMLFNSSSNVNGINPTGPQSKNRIVDVIELPAVTMNNETEALPNTEGAYPEPLLESAPPASSNFKNQSYHRLTDNDNVAQTSGMTDSQTILLLQPSSMPIDNSTAHNSLVGNYKIPGDSQQSPQIQNSADLSYLNDN